MPELHSDSPVVAALIAEIVQAFDDVPRGEITLHEAVAIDGHATDQERLDSRRMDSESRWQDVPDQAIADWSSALSFMDAQSFRYYLPAFMVWTLRNYRTSDAASIDMTVSHAKRGTIEPCGDRLTYQQRCAIARFLKHMVVEAGYPPTGMAERWGKYLD